MTILALGDTHGRTDWRSITTNTHWDKVVFIGDYFDTHEDVSPEQQIDNFKDIMAFKQANPDNVILLMGNHDYHYLPTVSEHYSGFEAGYAAIISKLVGDALASDHIQMAYIHGPYLFSHAGVTQTWLLESGYKAEEPLDLFMNKLIKTSPEVYDFTPGANYSPYGDDVCQTPIWVRPKSLLEDAVPLYRHVVGHTPVSKIVVKQQVVLIDALGTSKQFLAIVDGKVEVRDSE